jgi:hypothetical protein
MAKSVDKIKNDIVKTIAAMKANIKFYVAAKKSGDTKKLEKHKNIALDLTNKKKSLEAEMDKALGTLHADAELQIDEVRKLIRPLIRKTLKEADVFGGDEPAATADANASRDVEKLGAKFEGPLEPVIKLINTKDELHQAVELMINQVEQNKPGLAKKAKILLKKTVQNL